MNADRHKNFLEEISIVIVSDEGILERNWDNELNSVQAFTKQIGVNIVEIILVENQKLKGSFPLEKFSQIPNFRAIFTEDSAGSQLKNAGIREAKGSLIATFEADSHPEPRCLYLLCKSLHELNGSAACSARTIYQGSEASSLRRCLYLFGRGMVEPYKFGASNDAALFHASVAKAYPYPNCESPFIAASERNAILRGAGYKFAFNNDAISVHQFEGIEFEMEYRRQKGFQKMNGLQRKLLLRIPRIIFVSISDMFRAVRKDCGNRLRISDLPLALILILFLPLLEVPGMLDSFKGRTNAGTRFR